MVFGYHVVPGDPPTNVSLGPQEGPINRFELAAGVVGAFNAGYKMAAKAGGVSVNGVVLSPLLPHLATASIDRSGDLKITSGVGGAPGSVAQVQNLNALVENSKLSQSVLSTPWYDWGGVVNNQPLQPRSGLGVDANGNVEYVATMSPVSALELAAALVKAGAVTAMALDMNPSWPEIGVETQPEHHPVGFTTTLPGEWANPNRYFSSPGRSFFVVMARPLHARLYYGSAGALRNG